jgi:hypothetical protein
MVMQGRKTLSTSAIKSVLPSLEQARATSWPFRPYRGQPMGVLLDSYQLSLKDLNYALDNAYDPLVRQAAAVLIKARVDDSITAPARRSPAKVVSGGRSFMLRRQFDLVLTMGLLTGGMLGAGVVFTIWMFASRSSRSTAPETEVIPAVAVLLALLFTVVCLVAVFVAIRVVGGRMFDAYERRLDRYRRGQEGEDRVFETVLPVLDGQWTVFRNLTLPGRSRADLDMLLVGPAGLWLLEIKSYRGAYRNTGEKWEIYRGGRWKPAERSPSTQVRRNAVALNSFLKAKGIVTWVNPVVVWANPEAELRVEQPCTAVWTLELIHDELGKVLSTPTGKEEVPRRASEELTRLCEAAAHDRAEQLTNG